MLIFELRKHFLSLSKLAKLSFLMQTFGAGVFVKYIIRRSKNILAQLLNPIPYRQYHPFLDGRVTWEPINMYGTIGYDGF